MAGFGKSAHEWLVEKRPVTAIADNGPGDPDPAANIIRFLVNIPNAHQRTTLLLERIAMASLPGWPLLAPSI